MNHESTGSLASLAHPIIVSPEQGVETDKEGLFRLPFPEINLKWLGFTFSHLHWVGIKVTNPCLSKLESRRVGLALLHEFCHMRLALTPFSLVKKHKVIMLFDSIRTTFEEERERIEVPLSAAKSGNTLKEHWEVIVDLHRSSELVEEVHAVRSSLVESLDERFINPERLQDMITIYKEKYGEYMPAFPDIFDAFDFVAGKIGETASIAMIYSVLGTFNPSIAFYDIIFNLTAPNGLLWNGSYNDMRNFSFEQARHFFSEFTDRLDPDNSLYRRTSMLNIATKIKEEWSTASQDIEDDFGKFLFGTPTTILFSEYSHFRHSFSKLEVSEEVEYGNFILLLEAIRQQLTQGIGLHCPFWEHLPNTCCSSRNRALLEKVWKCTSPSSSCKLWKRLGCLKYALI